MKKNIIILFFLSIGLLISSCSNVSEKDLIHLNGYWEIEEVRSHGETFNPRGGVVLVDFYQMDGTTGFRKKLAPSLDKTYSSSKDQFKFSILKLEDEFYINYPEALEPWKEKILSISKTHLELEHSDKIYAYKRHEKISL